MIVTLTQTGYDIIFQPAHGLLAAKLASHWRLDERPRYWLELLVAVAQHDNNQRDFHRTDKLTEAGAPRGFTVSKGEASLTDLSQPKETLKDAFFHGSYLALMVSMHFSHLYGGKTANSELKAFLAEQAARQRQWRRVLGLNKAEAERDYRLMLWCDRASLVLCQDQLPADERRLEVEKTPTGEQSFMARRASGDITVTPWPFASETFEVGVEVRHLKQLSFHSDAELLQALEAASSSYRTWTFTQS
jgi:hypothetical protein